jgi:diguanylate cyclase (GGDEF)-like protein
LRRQLETYSDSEQTPTPAIQQAVIFLLFIAGYFVLGMAGLQLQSAQTGITPVWPASGFAFAMVYWFGLGHVIAIPPAMLALGWVLGLPLEAAALSAAGSMLEAGVPAYLLRRAGIDPGLRHLRDVLMFVVLGALLGPVLSASAGSVAFMMLGGSEFDLLRLWLIWWLGNSVGFLLVGGFGLVAVARRSIRLSGKPLMELLLACGAVIVITAIGLLQVVHIWSPLVFYLLIPVFILVAQRADQFPVLLLGVVAMAVTLLSASWLPAQSLAQTNLGILYLDVSLLWVVVFTGMIISSARQEMHAREQVSWLAKHDPLTRLLNRHAFMEHLEGVQASLAGRGETSHVLLLLDLDRFKDLNDAEGHRAGDQVLRDVGVLLGQEVRNGDMAARLGGDEFAVVLSDCPLLDACAIAENIRSAVQRYEYSGRRGIHRVEVSIGLAELTPDQSSPEDALHDADSACYEAKRAGRNRVWVHSGIAQADA